MCLQSEQGHFAGCVEMSRVTGWHRGQQGGGCGGLEVEVVSAVISRAPHMPAAVPQPLSLSPFSIMCLKHPKTGMRTEGRTLQFSQHPLLSLLTCLPALQMLEMEIEQYFPALLVAAASETM